MGLFRDCLFCDEQLDGVLWLSSSWMVMRDLVPVSPGHVEIIPLRHVKTLDKLLERERLDLPHAMDMAKYLILANDWKRTYSDALEEAPDWAVPFLEDALESKFLKKKPQGYNIGINEGT
ncbi:hypothetical protein GOV10_01890, partial [Candidatus Woesearchaeota archaeon]|nr:hypothetical protein [Candidatus Woesearchaeota archaeon]